MYIVEKWLAQDLRFQISRRVRREDKEPVEIIYGFGEAFFGRFLVAFSEFGLCWFEPFPEPDAQRRLLQYWAPASVVNDDEVVGLRLNAMLEAPDKPQKLHLCGTVFQLRVWGALICVPRSGVVNYGDLAKMLGNHRAARALGNALGANHIAIVVPCHRVKPVSGAIGNYRWGADLKQYLLNYEAGVSSLAA